MKLISEYLLLIMCITTNLACYNTDTLEEVEIPPDIWSSRDDERNEYDYYGNVMQYPQTTTAVSVKKERIKYRTIICSHIFSTESILYSYAEEDFEQHLKIQLSNISIINQCAFTNFNTITKLFLTNLDIKTILPGAFNGLTRLKELYLSYNTLEEISKGVYNSLHRLEILTLDKNKIHYIEDMAFTGTDSLVTLHLQNNKIEIFEKNLLKTQKHLSYLDLSQNPLTKVSLKSLSSLDTLNISHSLLQELDDNISHLAIKTLNIESSHLRKVDFSQFPKLNEIDLSDNKIKSLDNCENLVCIRVNLSHNDIEIINGTFGEVSHFIMSHNHLEILENFLLNASENVLSIDFSFNNISKIEKYAFLGLRQLNILHLQYNNISIIETILFKDLYNLRDLNLSHNNLQEFQYGTFDSLSNLQTLDISANRLKDLHQFTFNSLASLTKLYFDNNYISSFDANNLKSHLVSLHFVSLDNNPWKCEELVNVDQAFKKVDVYIKYGHNYNVENFHGIACQNGRDFINSLNNYQKSMDEGVKSSKLEQFFNGDFHKSKFVQYFDKDYSQSGFFKYLDSYRLTIGNFPNGTGNKMEQLIAFHNISNDSEKRILIFSAMCQVLIVCTLICGFFYMSSYLKKTSYNKHLQQIH